MSELFVRPKHQQRWEFPPFLSSATFHRPSSPPPQLTGAPTSCLFTRLFSAMFYTAQSAQPPPTCHFSWVHFAATQPMQAYGDLLSFKMFPSNPCKPMEICKVSKCLHSTHASLREFVNFQNVYHFRAKELPACS